ncbi:hypothetical protein OF83DRAFT_274137 [Amylostereum chailletii]|nr:hypothetical protein OF83DRAFT_274137 [Amylostereum chailletii]
MAEQAELAFVKNLVNTLASQPVSFDNDFQQPPENTLKRVPILQVELPSPPERKTQDVALTAVQITFKSLKPPYSVTISVSPADPISTIKTQIAAQPNAPPADAQRLLLKGKALTDSKLLKEYSIKEGDTVNLMVKPGFEWDPSKPTLVAPSPVPAVSAATLMPDSTPAKRRGHGRIPSVVLSPSPSPSMEEVHDIPLIDDSGLTFSADMPDQPTLPQSTYRTTISQPEFWERLLIFLKSEFGTRSDSLMAFEDYLNASKGLLTVNEIAKIRDHVGVVGMAGT